MEFDKQNAAGFYPICVQGGGSGNSTRYAAIFAKQDIPMTREWTVTGTPVPALAGLDHAMQACMQANGVRAAQLAVAKDGVTKFSRAYTWAEPGYRVTQPYDRSITIQELLDHMGGYDDDPNSPTSSHFDPTYNMRLIGQSQGHAVNNKLDVAHYMYARKLDLDPGTVYHYSNYGYLLAGAVVEKVTGMKYFDYVKKTLLDPAGLAEVKVISTLASGRTNDEAIAEDEGLGLSPLDLASTPYIPSVYGGDGEINEVGDPNDGSGASAHALTQFIHLHAVWGNGPRPANGTFGSLARSGSTPGASTLAVSRGDGIDWAYTINTRDWPLSTSPTLDDLGGLTPPGNANSITHVLDTTPIP